MYLGKVIGTVVATQKDKNLAGIRLLVVQPIDDQGKPDGEAHVATDTLGAGRGERVFLVSSREAVEALPDVHGPVDAAIVGIVDQVNSKRNFKNFEDCQD
ncbi:MAG: ethanolamine utilization protein EutN [Candidatus Latescibacterota bacterium]|nr:MAG: ethanolamine utilization protein EutN [Candidatus Latescibacterota bacterium]